MPKFGVSKESLEGMKPVPNSIYQVQLAGFEPKMSKAGDSVNLNPILKIVNSNEYNGQRIFTNLNTKAGFIMQDFAHAFGMPMEEHPTGDAGEMQAHLPGGPAAWKDSPDGDVTKSQYIGPLLGKIAKLEVVIEAKPGQKVRNAIKQFLCAIDSCATKYPDLTHSTNLIK